MTQEVSTQEILDKIAKDEDLTGEEIQRITHTDVKFRIQEELDKGKVAYAKTPYYDEVFVKTMHEIGARWNPYSKEWSVSADKKSQMRDAMVKAYGADGEYVKTLVITVKLKDDYFGRQGDEYGTDVRFHKFPVFYGFERDGGVQTNDDVWAQCDLEKVGSTGGSWSHPTVEVDKGAEFTLVVSKKQADLHNMTEDTELFEVESVKTVNPGSSKHVKHVKIVSKLMDEREMLIKQLRQVNQKLNDWGYDEAYETEDFIGIPSQVDDLLAKRKAKAERRIRRENERRKKVLEAQRESAAKPKEKTHLYIGPDKVVGATEKAICVKNGTSSFWFPKMHVKKQVSDGKCWLILKVRNWMILSDAENKDKTLRIEDLRKIYGDVNKAKTTGDEDDLDLALEGKCQPNLEAKGVEPDASLKR